MLLATLTGPRVAVDAVLGEPKVRQLHVAVNVEQDVLGLEVAVDDVERVKVGQRTAHLVYTK